MNEPTVVWQQGVPLTVTQIRRTCYACPSQWEGKTSTGDALYVRYRYGYLSARLYPDAGWAWDTPCVELIGKQLGDSLDGVLSYSDLVRQMPPFVTMPAQEW